MIGTLATLSLALVTGSSHLPAPQSMETAQDSSTVARADSTTPPRRTSARVGFGSVGPARTDSRNSPDATTAQRRHAVEHSDWYYRRLTIHKVASYATIPLFATEYYLGDKLFKGEGTGTTRSAHSAVATGVGVLFGVNTVTGVWNLWDSRNDTQGRARRITHSVLMLASDAGFLATAALAPGDDDEFEGGGSDDRDRHRAVAISSMGVSLASYLMMYIWK
jgi:hypothetical protein